MAQKIYWRNPENTTVTKVEINTSAAKYGSYTTATTVSAGAVGAWVSSYTHSTGNFSSWYKIRAYDGTNYSDYSDPVTSERNTNLCTIDDVKKTINTTGRWTDSEIYDSIREVDQLIYMELGKPLASSWSESGQIDGTYQSTFYTGEEDIWRIDRVLYGTADKDEYFYNDGFKANLQYGMVRILPVASGGTAVTSNREIEIHYVPGLYHKLSLYRTCQRLLEMLDFTSGGSVSKELDTINRKLKVIEDLINDRVAVQLSSDVQYYDGRYGVNRKHIMQDHVRNLYIGSYGWS